VFVHRHVWRQQHPKYTDDAGCSNVVAGKCELKSPAATRNRNLKQIVLRPWPHQLCLGCIQFNPVCCHPLRKRLNTLFRYTLCQFWCMGARLGPPQSTCYLASMHLTHGRYARSWGYRILAMCQMRKSEEPLVVHRFLTWWLIDVCASLAILLAVHLARITTEPLQHVSDKYRLTGSDQQEDLATLGSMQLRQTLSLWTLASRLPGERPLLETNGDNRDMYSRMLVKQCHKDAL